MNGLCNNSKWHADTGDNPRKTVREDWGILGYAAYVVLGITMESYKEILRIIVEINETSKFRLGMVDDLRQGSVGAIR